MKIAKLYLYNMLANLGFYYDRKSTYLILIGWQSRWFILEDGVLSYFKSYDEVSLGSKGSISLNVCEIIVHSNDHTRLDLNVSNEQYLYLKANSEKERQQWLIGN